MVAEFTERGSVHRPALDRLVAMPPAVFADEFWGRAPVLSRAVDLPTGFNDLFSIGSVDELVANRAIRTPFVRMANEGTVLDTARFTSSGGFGAEVGDQLDSSKVLREFADGATLVLQGLHRTWQPIADFTRALVGDLGHPAQVNAYVTPASSRGFDPHYDVHDVFVIQIFGEKHWTIHEPVHLDPLRDQPWTDHREAVAAKASGTPAIDETFRPGDVLYLPRGWIHSAQALGGTSIHLTIGVSALTRWDIVQRLVAAATSDVALRGSLPLGIDYTDAAALAPLIESTIASLTTTLQGTASEQIGDALAGKLSASIRPAPVLPLATIESLGAIGADTPVVWRDGLRARVRRDEQHATISLGTRTVTLPGEAFPALEELERREPVAAGHLRGLDPESSLVVARRLVREGVLIVSTDRGETLSD